MKAKTLLAFVILIVIAAGAVFFAYKKGYNEAATKSESFNGCIIAGNSVQMSDPPQCRDEAGIHFAP